MNARVGVVGVGAPAAWVAAVAMEEVVHHLQPQSTPDPSHWYLVVFPLQYSNPQVD